MDLDQALKIADSAVASYGHKRGALRILAKYVREYKSLSDSDALHQSPSRQQPAQLSEPFERRPELMEAHKTNETRWKVADYPADDSGNPVLQQRYKWDDGTCAGWRDVPVVE